MISTTPFVSRPMDIQKDWIDYNGHLNMAYYNVLFDRCSDEAFELMGMGPDYVKSRRLTVYTAEIHVCYVRELHLGHTVTGTFQLLDHDEKRLHAYQEIRHSDGWLAATSESLTLHIDMEGPKVAPFPNDVAEKVAQMAQTHANLPTPERAGRSIGIKRKPSS
ncbi:thioesterase [Mesorhizobium sp. NBSH29]|uniref:thioesterase family protein n=1 Tax=Mesorhizobium sp. NBSH29 TaxID=2654249 RepID=UPI0018C09C0A|nr:thioesterase family protein [Mesorhizobium sp. NBSH29]QPC88177.1 thioesterase [Mesorhizobium sp. NBSH29]